MSDLTHPTTSNPMLADPERALRIAGVLGAATLLLFAAIWVTATRDGIQWMDDQFLRLVRELRWSPAADLAKALAFIGGAYVTWIVRGVVFGILARRRHWVHLTALGLAVASSEALIGTTKALYDRARPAGSVIATSGASFPSGHAIAATITAVGIVIVLLPAGHARWKWERRAVFYAFLIALSRAYLGAHWLSDVVGGALLGSTLAIGWPALLVVWRALSASRQM